MDRRLLPPKSLFLLDPCPARSVIVAALVLDSHAYEAPSPDPRTAALVLACPRVLWSSSNRPPLGGAFLHPPRAGSDDDKLPTHWNDRFTGPDSCVPNGL